MKIPGQLKLLNLIVFLIVLSSKVFGQNASFIPDPKKDSIWIQQSLIIANNLHPILLDSSGSMRGRWIGGKILYSPDGLLRATQLIGDYNTFITTIEYVYHHKIFKQDLGYKSDFSSYALTGIYKLPDKSPAYLFLLSEIENVPDYEHDRLNDFLKISNSPSDTAFRHIKRLTYVASALRLDRDTLFETTFPLTTSQAADTANLENSKSYGFTSDIKQSEQSPRPFLKYDSLTHMLNFLDVSYKRDADESTDTSFFMVVESGAFQYRDTSFVLANDTSYYYPSLQSLNKILARKSYQAGKYTIKAEADESYEDFGEGGIWSVLTMKYKIGNQTLTCINNDGYDEKDEDLTPDYKLQNNSSLILLLTDLTNGHGPGMCGAADYIDSHFWLIDNNNKPPQQLFSFSSGSCSPSVTYTFTQNGKEISGNFYLTDSSDKEDINFEDSYWKNNSTYIFVISNAETNLSRNFYLHFNALNKKAPVRLTAGKLYKAKKQASQ